jgi:hypothetical protein
MQQEKADTHPVRTFVCYLREVFSTGWGTVFFMAGIISTLVTFILAYRPKFVLPYWLPGAISIAAWLIAPYRLYQKQVEQIALLEGQRQQRRRAKLVVIGESGGFYIRCFTPPGITPKRETGMYLELVVSVENKGERPATITRYDLNIEGIGTFTNQRPSPQNYVLGQNAQHALNVADTVKNYIEVPAERLAAHQRIPFMLNSAPPTDIRKLHCELTISDTEGNSAIALLEPLERGARFAG